MCIYILLFIFLAFIALLAWLLASGHYVIFSIMILLILGICRLLAKLSETAIESGMREKYPFDYLMRIGWVIKKFETAGFTRGEYIAPGTDFPGVYMKKGDTVLSIILKADTSPYKIMCMDSNNTELFSIYPEKSKETEPIVDEFLQQLI